jgi:hypothetical protein
MASSSDPERRNKPLRPSTKFFSESNVDGFVDDQPVWVAFCDECGTKLTAEEHAKCPYQERQEKDEEGNVIAFRCRRCRR